MPTVSEKQRKAMWAAANGHSTLGIPQEVGKEFVGKDSEEEIEEIIIPEFEGEIIGFSRDISKKESQMTDYDVALAIKDGLLPSPQKFKDVWIFDLRITGTGMAYRSAGNEFVYRKKEDFLTDEFINRCNGLAVIFEHPEDKLLDTKEFRDRSIGSVIIPYIKGDEVWGISKIFDEDAALLMQSTHISTSPGVSIKPDDSKIIEIDGRKVLIEGEPLYLDHLAVCEQGVWDKLESPSGINLGEKDMTTENAVEAVKADEAEEKAPKWFADAMCEVSSKMDSITSRMDAMESKKEEKADGIDDVPAPEMTMDSEESEEEKKEKADAEEMKKEFKEMAEKVDAMTKPLDDKEKDEISAAQARADSVMQLHGKVASQPLFGESPISYRKRLVESLKGFSEKFSKVSISKLDEFSFPHIEELIYADAQSAAKTMHASSPGLLIKHVRKDATGRTITEYSGDPMAVGAFGEFNTSPQYISIRGH